MHTIDQRSTCPWHVKGMNLQRHKVCAGGWSDMDHCDRRLPSSLRPSLSQTELGTDRLRPQDPAPRAEQCHARTTRT